MKHVLIFSLMLSSFAYGNILEKAERVQSKMMASANKYCNEGVKDACALKNAFNDPENLSPKTPSEENLTEADKKEMLEMQKMIKTCNNDTTCMKKVASEMTQKRIKSFAKECRKGIKEACFWEENLQHTLELQNLF